LTTTAAKIRRGSVLYKCDDTKNNNQMPSIEVGQTIQWPKEK